MDNAIKKRILLAANFPGTPIEKVRAAKFSTSNAGIYVSLAEIKEVLGIK